MSEIPKKYNIDNAKNDIQNLQVQNSYDFQEIKRLDSLINEYDKRVTQAINLNNLINKKIQDDYEKIKKVIIDESIDILNWIKEQGLPGVGGTNTEEKLLLKYTYNSNKIVQPTGLDFETGVFTCATGHGLNTGDKLLLDFTPQEGEYFIQTKILKELFEFDWTTWYFMIAEVVSDKEFKLKNNLNNTYLTYKESNSPKLDFNAFRFQVANQITLNNLDLSNYRKLKFKLNLNTIGQYYCDRVKVLKLTNNNFPFLQNVAKVKEWTNPECLLYPNKSMDVDANAIYGHAAKFRNDLIENVIIIQENSVARSTKMTSIGYNGNYSVHENNNIIRNYTNDSIFKSVGYNDGNMFLDTIILPQELKILNDSVIEIYSLEG